MRQLYDLTRRCSKIEISLGQSIYQVDCPRLKKYLFLVETLSEISEAGIAKDHRKLASYIIDYIAIAIEEDINDDMPWYEYAGAYLSLLTLCNLDIKLPMLLYRQDENSDEAWDYTGRVWYFWAHSLASRYGWTLEYVANLTPEDAIALMQEILVEDQFSKEWEWNLSDIAYSSDKHGHITHKELPRPVWMTVKPKHLEIKKIKIKRDFLPVGKVVRWNEAA